MWPLQCLTQRESHPPPLPPSSLTCPRSGNSTPSHLTKVGGELQTSLSLSLSSRFLYRFLQREKVDFVDHFQYLFSQWLRAAEPKPNLLCRSALFPYFGKIFCWLADLSQQKATFPRNLPSEILNALPCAPLGKLRGNGLARRLRLLGRR